MSRRWAKGYYQTMDIRHTTPREGYDLWASNYDGYDNPLIALEEPVVAALIGPVAGLRVADIGCGTGRFARRLAAAGARVTGVDFSPRMLDVVRRNLSLGALQLVQHDLNEGIPLASDCFDLVICCLVIEHLLDIDRMMRELSRICRPRGHVIISDFHPEMVRRGYHARFHERESGEKFQISGAYHPVSSYVMAAVQAELRIAHISEHVMDEATAERSRSARKWIGLPLLLVLKLTA